MPVIAASDGIELLLSRRYTLAGATGPAAHHANRRSAQAPR
jgi:hypothetical protein